MKKRIISPSLLSADFANLKSQIEIKKIDFVIVNFYPFTKISNREFAEKKLEMIDIGGPSMIRSASKNFASVTTICDKKFYDPLIKELIKNNGVTSLAFRKKLAEKNCTYYSN